MANAASSSPPPRFAGSVSATEAKNNFGAVLDRVLSEGRVVITKHDEVRAVILSATAYEALIGAREDTLASLGQEFDSLVAHMQTPNARAAGRALFDATPKELARAALKAPARARARRKRG